MKIFIICCSLLFTSLCLADVSTSTQKNQNEQKSLRDSKQTNEQESNTVSKTIGDGIEKSNAQTITNTLNRLQSSSSTITQTANGTLGLNVNPISYMLDELRNMGWNPKAFFLTFDDLGIGSYVTAQDDRYGELQDLGRLEGMRNEASRQKKLSQEQSMRIGNYAALLYNTAELIKNAMMIMQSYPSIHIEDFETVARDSLRKAYKSTQPTRLNIGICNYGSADLNSYTCENGRFTLVLTNGIPNLLVNGTAYYSSTTIAHITPTLNVSYASSTQDAFTKLTQSQQSNSIAKSIRDYTNKLEQQGQSKTASQIKSKFVEKSLTTGVTQNANAVISAINSGSPTAVLKIFQ